jgi:hypothetical protein
MIFFVGAAATSAFGRMEGYEANRLESYKALKLEGLKRIVSFKKLPSFPAS